MELIEALAKIYDEMGWKIFLKVHVLNAHLDNFKENMGAYLEEKESTSIKI